MIADDGKPNNLESIISNSISKDEDGNTTYTYEDGTIFEGDTETLTQQIEEYNLSEEYKNIETQMKDILNEITNGAGEETPPVEIEPETIKIKEDNDEII